LVAVSETHARLFVFAIVSALSYAVASRGTYTQSYPFYRPRALAVGGSGAFYLYHRQRDPPGIFYSSLDPRPGTTARTAPIIGILQILGRYRYRYNFRPRVVTPSSKAEGIGTRHR
jgi:hypothetical protein